MILKLTFPVYTTYIDSSRIGYPAPLAALKWLDPCNWYQVAYGDSKHLGPLQQSQAIEYNSGVIYPIQKYYVIGDTAFNYLCFNNQAPMDSRQQPNMYSYLISLITDFHKNTLMFKNIILPHFEQNFSLPSEQFPIKTQEVICPDVKRIRAIDFNTKPIEDEDNE